MNAHVKALWILLFSSPHLKPVKCFVPLSLLNINWRRHYNHAPFQQSQIHGGTNGDDEWSSLSDAKAIKERLTNLYIIERLLGDNVSDTDSPSSLIELSFLGQGTIGKTNDKDTATTCLYVTHGKPQSSPTIDALPIPLAQNQESRILRLLRFAYLNKPISKSLCLTLSPLLINRDGGLYDNLPWSTWTIDPEFENRDAANNPVEKKYHLGKRNAYNRFMGRDWFGRSVSIGNLAARARYLLENSKQDKEITKDGVNDITMDQSSIAVLARRVLELEVKEAKMACAEAEEQLALVRSEVSDNTGGDLLSLSDDQLVQNYDVLQDALSRVEETKSNLDRTEQMLIELNESQQASNERNNENDEVKSILTQFLESIILTNEQKTAPYRGAIGFTPTIDTPEEMFEKAILPYSSPYQLMHEIIEEQLNAEVIGCGLENTSLFPGSIVLGGFLILRRKGRKKKVTIAGEDVEFEDIDDDFGNIGVEGGITLIVECECDEAIGMALTGNIPIVVYEKLWAQNAIKVKRDNVNMEKTDIEEIYDIPHFDTDDQNVRLETQGDGIASTGTNILSPRDTRAMPNFFASKGKYTDYVFKTENPIQSLDQYDNLTTSDKAQLLLSFDSFTGNLPRPRNLAQNEKNESNQSLNPLDELLLPLVDESVRRQILIREAKRRGEEERVTLLEESKSLRQMAMERSIIAKKNGDDDLAHFWDTEAEFYASLRADVTQDEGSYSSFLDRDEWYERDRLAVARRIDKKKFGTLLDGIE